MTFVRQLVWDAWNVGHIARHDVTPAEVEEVCHREPIQDETYKGRLRLVGATDAGRMLTLILAPDEAQNAYNHCSTGKPQGAAPVQ